jgi:predicted nucleotidyltransferase
MPPAAESLIRDIADTVIREVQPQAIVLFGSHATGEARPDSDVDLLIVAAAPFSPGRSRRQEMTRIWRALARFPVGKDILVFSAEEVAQWRGARNHVIARALREGRVIYGTV